MFDVPQCVWGVNSSRHGAARPIVFGVAGSWRRGPYAGHSGQTAQAFCFVPGDESGRKSSTLGPTRPSKRTKPRHKCRRQCPPTGTNRFPCIGPVSGCFDNDPKLVYCEIAQPRDVQSRATLWPHAQKPTQSTRCKLPVSFFRQQTQLTKRGGRL